MTTIIALTIFLGVYTILAVAGKAVLDFVRRVNHTFQ